MLIAKNPPILNNSSDIKKAALAAAIKLITWNLFFIDQAEEPVQE